MRRVLVWFVLLGAVLALALLVFVVLLPMGYPVARAAYWLLVGAALAVSVRIGRDWEV